MPFCILFFILSCNHLNYGVYGINVLCIVLVVPYLTEMRFYFPKRHFGFPHTHVL